MGIEKDVDQHRNVQVSGSDIRPALQKSEHEHCRCSDQREMEKGEHDAGHEDGAARGHVSKQPPEERNPEEKFLGNWRDNTHGDHEGPLLERLADMAQTFEHGMSEWSFIPDPLRDRHCEFMATLARQAYENVAQKRRSGLNNELVPIAR